MSESGMTVQHLTIRNDPETVRKITEWYDSITEKRKERQRQQRMAEARYWQRIAEQGY